MDQRITEKVCLFLQNNPGFIKTYILTCQAVQNGDRKAKELIDTLLPDFLDVFLVINQLMTMASEGDENAKKLIFDDFNSGTADVGKHGENRFY